MTHKDNVIETVDVDGKELKLVVRTPGHKVRQEAQMIYNLKLTELIRQSATEGTRLLSKQQLDQYLEKLGLWTDENAKKFIELQLQLRDLELKLKTGGIKVTEAKTIALGIKAKRTMLLVLYNRRAQFEDITMESIADTQKFKFLLTQCVMDQSTGKKFFDDIDDYEDRQGEQAAIDAATVFAGKLYGYDDKTEANLCENQWLKEYKFADDKGRLINEAKHLVDTEGRLINEDGRFVNKTGKLVDNQGRLVDENGNFVVATKPFLDDETGEPLPIGSKRKKKNRKN